MIICAYYITLLIFIAPNVCSDKMCTDPIEKGPCDLRLVRYAFNRTSKKCQQFVYGGCGSSRNVFDSIELCRRICITNSYQDYSSRGYMPKKPAWKQKRLPRIYDKPIPKVPGANKYNLQCRQPMSVGKCKNFSFRWYFDTKSNSCKSFRYSGCGGNSNRFNSIFECEKTCSMYIRDPAHIPTSMCSQPKKLGECFNYQIRWYYVPNDEECKTFVYGGCGGNLNNFASKEVCEKNCKLASKLPSKKFHRNPICLLDNNIGNGNQNITRYYYNFSEDNCLKFQYKGTNGNENNFQFYFECMIACSSLLSDGGTTIEFDDLINVAEIGYF